MRRLDQLLRNVPVAICLALMVAAPAVAHEGLHEQIVEITKQIKREPKNASLYLKRGELYRLHREWTAAFADYRRAERLDSHLTSVKLARGRAYLDAGKLEQAREWLNRFVADEPKHVEGLVTRARLLLRMGQQISAGEDYSRAIEQLSSPSPDYYIERARALVAAGPGHVDAALAGIDEGIKKMGPIVTLELLAIELELSAKRYDGALTRIERIAAQSPRKESWLVRRGEILLSAGRADEARVAFKAALASIESLPVYVRETKATKQLKERVRVALGE